MFWKNKAKSGAVVSADREIAIAITGLTEALQAHPSEPIGTDRLSALEGQLAAMQGIMDSTLIKAESLKAAARASEERERGHMTRAEKALELARGSQTGAEEDPFEVAGREYAALEDEQFPIGNAERGEGLPAVPAGMGSGLTHREIAKAAKRR
jgi:hypothetical protein